jgi:hypothetical protein
MDKRFIGAGVALFLLGALIGWALSGSDSDLQTELTAARNQETRLAALSEDLATMNARLEEVGTVTSARLDEIGVATGGFDQAATGMGERLDAIATELARQYDALAQRAASLEQVQKEQSAALAARVDQIGSSLEGLGQRLSGELVTPDPVAWNTLARQLKEMHDTVAQIGGGGKQAAGGTEQQATPGEETPAGDDTGARTPAASAAGGDAGAATTVPGAAEGAADAGNQGGGNAAGGTAQSADADAQPAEGTGDEQTANGASESGGTELRVGHTAKFEEGAVRVFLSAVTPDAQTARVAVNGFTLTTLELGAPVTIEDCELELTNVRQDEATLSVRCAASAQQREGAAKAP